MKNYFDFKLSGSRIFPYFLCIFLSYIGYLISNTYAAMETDMLSPLRMVSIGVLFLYMIVVVMCIFYIYRFFIVSISYKDEMVKFDGAYKEYLKINAIGILLTIVTLGIYSCWYDKKLTDFFARNSSYNNIKFQFNGQAIILFAIITTFLVIIMILSTLFGIFMGNEPVTLLISLFIIILILSAPVSYFIYRWYIDLSYANKKIKMTKGEHFRGICFFLLQIVLMIITCGIYAPAALIRIYRYFANRIEVRNEEGVLESKMGCEAKMGEDFIFIFAQMLLIMVTFGIYYPWAICIISERLITKTYIETVTQ